MRAEVILGDCLDVMRTMPAASVDAVITDPPYGLKFMGKLWDHGVPGEQFWAEALRVAKPGAALLAFGGTRTFHRLACAIEDGGWRIYDCLAWMYGQGFPKHRTHLKPAWEPIVFASKKGARFVNVEGCRLGTTKRVPGSPSSYKFRMKYRDYKGDPDAQMAGGGSNPNLGRWPANVVLDEEAARMVDEMSGTLQSGSLPAGTQREGVGWHGGLGGTVRNSFEANSGGASRFFYCSKASSADREGSTHPTMKPTDLMRWLCRLVTPPGGTVLDPFCGSGSTGVAANAEGFDFIGIEREAEYVEIARRRIANVAPLFATGAA